MTIKITTSALAVLMALATATSNTWGQLSGHATRLKTELERELTSLKQSFERVIPTIDQGKKAAYFKAREDENAAIARLEKAQERRAAYGNAKALVDHAKGKWIGDATKNLARAQQSLKDAQTADQRETAQKEIAKWEENKKEGELALKERQAKLDKAERDKPAAEKEYQDARQHLADAKAKTSEALDNLGLASLLASDALDAHLAKYVVIMEATPTGLANSADQGPEQRQIIERMLSDEDMLIQMVVADGAKGGNYGRAMEILREIENASQKAREGTLQRLALAIALEHAVPIKQRNAVAAVDAPSHVDPVARYLQYEKAFLGGELDPAFANLTVWDMRMIVDGEEPNEISIWGREMLRNFRPDHVTMQNYGWRYVALVRSDIPYGSQDVKYDQDELQFFQNILMNGGICGRRAFIGRFILRAFGIPTIARPQRGHAALAHWTPDGWVINLGARWGSGWTRTAYRNDLDFLATTQARALGGHYLQVKRAQWIGDVMGEKRVWGFNDRDEPQFWNGVALYTQKALIEAADAKTLGPLGADIAEATETKEKIEIPDVEISDQERVARVEDGIIRIPAAATSNTTGRGIQFMDSFLGGAQLHYSRGAQNATFEYAFQAPRSGKYALIGLVANPTWKQGFLVTINGASEPLRKPIPHTIGLWESTEPIEVELNNGRNVIKFERFSDASPKGISIREFILVPWDRRHTIELWSTNMETTPEDKPRLSNAARHLLGTSLLRDLATLSANQGLEPLPMDLTFTNSRVRLVDASGSSILAFQALDGDKIARVALDDLTLEDHAMLSRLVARIKANDMDANARAAVYMDYTDKPAIADSYRRIAGPEAVERFATSMQENPLN